MTRKLTFLALLILSAILIGAGAILAYWLTHEVLGYRGGKSVIFYIGGAFLGYLVTEPLWRRYSRDRG
jgi:hypothetical protein